MNMVGPRNYINGRGDEVIFNNKQSKLLTLTHFSYVVKYLYSIPGEIEQRREIKTIRNKQTEND